MTNTQASFDGFAPAVPTDRLFFALFPEAIVAERMALLATDQRARHGLHGRALRTDRLHVTLFHLGDWVGLPAQVVNAAMLAGSRLRSPAVDICFDQVASFAASRDDKPLVLRSTGGNAPLRALHLQFARELAAAGLTRAARESFEPHVTLAYDRRVVPIEAVAPVGWCASEIVLIHSLLGQTRHIPLARWPLG